MIQEMETAVFKRKTIQLKYQKASEAKKSGKLTQAQVNRQINTLKSNLKISTSNIQSYDNQIQQNTDESKQVEQDIKSSDDH